MRKTVPIKKNYEFMRLYKKGKFSVGKYLVAYILPNRVKINRLGITVSRKFGKSVKRNRIKRLVRENYRLMEHLIKDGFDIVFVARKNEKMPSYTDIKKEMKFLLRKLGVFDGENGIV